MYNSIARAAAIGNERRIIIDEVNPTQSYISGHDSFGKIFRVAFDSHGPVVSIPVQGEMWVLTQYSNEWRLARRLETGDEATPIDQLRPGDRRVDAPADLHLNGAHILINGVDFDAVISDVTTDISDEALARIAGDSAEAAVRVAADAGEATARVAGDTTLQNEINGITGGAQLTAVEQSGTLIGTRHAINLIPGANITLNVTDNAGQDRVDVTITGNVQTPPGIVSPYAGASAPSGWLMCDGSAVSRSTFSALFGAIGTTYGVGDGTTTFNIPDTQGRMVVGKGTHSDVSTLGANDGLAASSRTFKHYHSLGTIAVTASGAHGHTFTGTLATITGGAHGHTFTGSAVTSSTESQTHTHGTGTLSAGTDSQGSHSHGGSTSSGNAHSHGYQFSDYSASAVLGGTGGTYAGTSHTLQTDVLPAHSHTISSDGAHTHTVTLSGSTGNTSVTHTHSVTAAGTISNTDTHTHSYTPQGTLSSTDTHVHNTADFSGLVGTTTGVADAPARIVLNYIIKT